MALVSHPSVVTREVILVCLHLSQHLFKVRCTSVVDCDFAW